MNVDDERLGLFQLLDWLLLNDPEIALQLLRENEYQIWTDGWGTVNGSGLLIDAGGMFGDETLVAEGVSRLEDVVIADQQLSDEILSTALYNAGNGHQMLAEVASSKVDRDPDCKHLQAAKTMYRRAIELDANISARECASLYTNYGNVLAACGRHYDALIVYDQAIRIDSTHSMALENKGIELVTYASLSGSHPGALRSEAFELCDVAAKDVSLDAAGHSNARLSFAGLRNLLAPGADHYRTHLEEERVTKSSVRRRTKRDLYLHEFFQANGLYLNLCVHDWPCSENDIDSLFFDYVTPIGESTRFHKLARYFNQIKEDFATARYLLANSVLQDVQRNRVSNWTRFADLLEYADYGIQGGLVKTALSNAYNILDKIAVFIMLEIQIRQSESNIYFSRMWRLSDSSTLRSEIRRTGDWNLFALYDLARDLEKEPLSRTGRLRRAITHRHLVSHDFLLLVGEGSEPHDHILFDDLVEEGITILQLVKSAIVYLAAYLHQQHIQTVEEKGKEHFLPMPIVWQHDLR